ncbi:MAG: hypothetical protein ACP5MD_13440 [Verrucomicrobiia bacterium]
MSILNTTVLELTLLVQTEYDPHEYIDAGLLPNRFHRLLLPDKPAGLKCRFCQEVEPDFSFCH